DEPALPKSWRYGFYSVEWGRSEIDLHPLTPSGATWKAETRQFLKMPRPTDLDVDGAGHLYAVSWDGATFTYNGPNVGYIIRLAPKEEKSSDGVRPSSGAAPPEHRGVPEFKKLSEAELVGTLGSGSAVWRQAAQRELLVRGVKPGVAKGLQQLIAKSDNIGVRVTAIFTLKQLLGEKAHPALLSCLEDDNLREFALKALADDPRVAELVPAAPFKEALNDKDPR